jgi:predicted ATPase
MITKLRIQNFKCLRDVTIELGGLTVLIGLNDSGKSSILEAIHLLGETTRQSFRKIFQGPLALDKVVWRREPSRVVEWSLAGSSGEAAFSYDLGLREGRIEAERLTASGEAAVTWVPGMGWELRDEGGSERVEFPGTEMSGVFVACARKRASPMQLAEAIRSTGRYRLDPDSLRMPAIPTAGAVLSPTGDNLAAVLDGLISGPDRRAVVALESALNEAIPTLNGLSVPPAPGGRPGEKVIEFVLAGNGKRPITIPCELASDGAMLLTAFLTLAYSDSPDLLLIKEPENGLHPARLKDVVMLLRKIASGEIGNRPRQVVLTTHSPLLLNFAKPEEVRIVRRDLETGTTVTPMDQIEGIGSLLDEFGVGELWYLLGEQGLVEGDKP